MRLVFTLYLMLIPSCALFAAEEESAPIWQQGSVMLIQAVGFIILVFCIYKFLLKPVSEQMEQRQKQIEEAYSDAEKSKQFCEEKQAEYEEMIKHADEEIQTKISEAVKQANAIKESKINEGIAEAKRRMELAEATIENEKEKAAAELRAESGVLGVKIASKILNEELDVKKHEKLINSFIEELD